MESLIALSTIWQILKGKKLKFLIIYSSTDGQTKKIADFIANKIESKVESVQVISIDELHANILNDFTHIVLGASIRYGKFNSKVFKLIETELMKTSDKFTAFYSVNLTARKMGKDEPHTNAYTRKLLEKTNWKPNSIRVFAGALLYPKYGVFDKFMIKLIMKMTGGETNTSKQVEYTDWVKVEAWANELIN